MALLFFYTRGICARAHITYNMYYYIMYNIKNSIWSILFLPMILVTYTSFINGHKQRNNLKQLDLVKYFLDVLFKVAIISVYNIFMDYMVFFY